MLISETKTGKRVNARNANKGEDYFCPVCKSPLILRQGQVRVHHFAHTSNENKCIFRNGGEGPNHDLMKTVVKKLLDKDNPYFQSEFEYRFNNGRIADICYKNKYHTIAIECVDKHTNIKDFEEKLRDYKRDNIKSMWIFDSKKFQYEDYGDFKDEMRTTEIMRRCHQMNYAKIWAVDTELEVMWAIHFGNVYSTRTFFDEETYETWEYEVKLTATKEIIYHLQQNLKFYLKTNNSYNKHIVGPYCESFWKK